MRFRLQGTSWISSNFAVQKILNVTSEFSYQRISFIIARKKVICCWCLIKKTFHCIMCRRIAQYLITTFRLYRVSWTLNRTFILLFWNTSNRSYPEWFPSLLLQLILQIGIIFIFDDDACNTMIAFAIRQNGCVSCRLSHILILSKMWMGCVACNTLAHVASRSKQ